MRVILTVIDKLTLVLGFVAAAAVVIMMAQVTLDVVLETLFNWPLPATLTLVADYYMPLVAFLPLAYVERLGNHVAADVVTQFLPVRGQKHLYGWIYLLCFVVCAMLTYATWFEAVDKYHIGSFSLERGTKIATWPVRFAAPFSYGLLAVLFMLKFVAYIGGHRAFEDTPSSLRFFTSDDDLGGVQK